ncbi:DUF6146 family protein [Flavobacteriaceae bacterium F08102]|nr:DUF6146 family protein [Flavobacteriaceae bacterium F08102]
MKTLFSILILGLLVYSCGSATKTVAAKDTEEKPVRIANDTLEYEVIIFDVGFSSYLATAKPMSFYSQSMLESRNRVYVDEWNNRVRNPSQYDSRIYENIIDYQPNIDYGMEVNYKLYQYFQFAQRKYNMKLGPFRIE